LVYKRGVKYLTENISSEESDLNGSENVEEDRQRAEVFDALSHPTRIMILKALNEGPVGFADLKKKLCIESSGHLQHHLSKLGQLIKTDEYGKYTLSEHGKDALLSIQTVEKVTENEPKSAHKTFRFKKNVTLKAAVIALSLLLVMTSAIVALEYTTVSSLQSTVSSQQNLISQSDSLANKLNSEVDQRDTFILQLDTALNLTQSRLNLNFPNGPQYLTALPNANSQGNLTKILLESSAAWYHYAPGYPFNITWFNETTHYGSSVQMVPLTENRSVPISFFGFNIGSNDNYEYAGEGGEPYLMIGITIRNDYTYVDAGSGSDPNAPIGNSTPYLSMYQLNSSYVSFVNLSIKLFSQNGSVIPADLSGIQSPRNLNTLERGGEFFPIGSGETKQVVFYLYPSSLDIGDFEINVLYLSSVPPS